MTGIGVLREGPLHAAIKTAIARAGDRQEVPVDGFVIDIVRADGELVEIQTGGFTALGRKLDALLDAHRVRIVHPVAARTTIVRVDADGEILAQRRSPKRATALEVFDKLVAFPSLLSHPNLAVEVLLLHEQHLRGPAATVRRGRRRDPGERRMLELLGRVELKGPAGALELIGALPPAPFTTREVAAALECRTVLAQRVVYCLRLADLLEPAGRRGAAPLYRPRRAATRATPSKARARSSGVAGIGPRPMS